MSRNTLLKIQGLTPRDDLHGRPEQWNDVQNIYGDVHPLSGREYLMAQQMESSVSHRIRTQFIPGANSRMRLIKPAQGAEPERVFNVDSVVNVEEKNRELEWMCTEVV